MYFVAIGIGYILIEVAFIQRFVLFLGHPVYALTVVVFLMLLSSGVGSLASRDLLAETTKVIMALALIVAGLMIAVFELPLMLTMLVGLPFAIKLMLSAMVLVPLGFFMGMPFPTGLRALATAGTEDSLIEWAWAMNAAASVLGSVAAMVIAIHFGLNVTLATGAAAYVAAMAFSLPLLRREAVSPSVGQSVR